MVRIVSLRRLEKTLSSLTLLHAYVCIDEPEDIHTTVLHEPEDKDANSVLHVPKTFIYVVDIKVLSKSSFIF